MTHVYGNDHTCMMDHVNVEHTMGEGQRYRVDMSVSCYMDYELMAGDHLIATCVFGQSPSASYNFHREPWQTNGVGNCCSCCGVVGLRRICPECEAGNAAHGSPTRENDTHMQALIRLISFPICDTFTVVASTDMQHPPWYMGPRKAVNSRLRLS